MNFKLPEDPKKRMQVLIGIGAGVVVVIVGIYMGAISPMHQSKQAALGKIEELTKEVETANNEIAKVPGDTKANIQALTRAKELSDKCILPPGLDGGYHLVASAIIERHAKAVGVTVDTVQDRGVGDLCPVPGRGASAGSLKAYSARVTMSAGYKDVVRLIRAIANDNALVCITGLDIRSTGAKDKTARKHTIWFDVQWPVWIDTEMPSKLAAQLKEQPAEEPKPEIKKEEKKK